MTFFSASFGANARTFAATAVLGVTAISAHADLVIPVNALQADSVQVFPTEVLQAFRAEQISVTGAGTASATTAPGIGGNSSSFDLPITKVVIGSSLNLASGSAVGAALVFNYLDIEGATHLLTLANFTIDYTHGQVLADTSYTGGPTVKQMPIYTYSTSAPLSLKYQFPLSISLYQQLDKLLLTPQAQNAFMTGLNLPSFASPFLAIDYGTLTQTIHVAFRAKPINPKPFVATN